MGSISDHAIGVGTSVLTPAALTSVHTGSLRIGDLGFTIAPGGENIQFYWFNAPTSLAVVGADVVLSDIARGSAVNPGRWHQTNVAYG